MAAGWVKLHREIMQHEVWADPVTLKVFLWCVMTARRAAQEFRGERLQPGQFTTGRKVAAVDLEMHESQVYRTFQRLQAMGCIVVEANKVRTIVTVCNWRTYQDGDDDTEHQSNNDRTL